jgi:hypothetical protein
MRDFEVGLSQRELIRYGTAGAVTALTTGKVSGSRAESPEEFQQAPLPMQVATDRTPSDKTQQSPAPGST